MTIKDRPGDDSIVEGQAFCSHDLFRLVAFAGNQNTVAESRF
jgi:hypothetical protein